MDTHVLWLLVYEENIDINEKGVQAVTRKKNRFKRQLHRMSLVDLTNKTLFQFLVLSGHYMTLFWLLYDRFILHHFCVSWSSVVFLTPSTLVFIERRKWQNEEIGEDYGLNLTQNMELKT